MNYKVYKHKIKIENKDINSYGLKVYDKEKLVCTIFDVSTELNAITKLVNSLNDEEIELIHLESILEDFYLDNV